MKRLSKAAVLTAAAGAAVLGASGGAVADGGGAAAKGLAAGSPGIVSGNVIQVPINIPINACGNSINVVGLFNPAFGAHCING